jgi:hypothetical protein
MQPDLAEHERGQQAKRRQQVPLARPGSRRVRVAAAGVPAVVAAGLVMSGCRVLS